MASTEGKASGTEDYKVLYVTFQQNFSKESTVQSIIKHVDGIDNLSLEQREYFIKNIVPYLLLKILKTSHYEDDLIAGYFKLLKRFMKIIIKTMVDEPSIFLSCIHQLFNLDSRFYTNRIFKGKLEEEGDADLITTSFAQLPTHLHTKKSPLYRDIIDIWGNLGGFQIMKQQLKDEESDFYIISNHLVSVANLRTSEHLLESVFDEFLKVIWFETLPNVRKVSVETLKQTNKDAIKITSIMFWKIGSLGNIETRHLAKVTDTLALDIASQCLHTGTLEKRLFAVSQTTTMIHSIASKDKYIYVDEDYMTKWIKTNGLLDQIFGEGKHSQLVKNSHSIVKFLSYNSALDLEDLELIWSCATTTHESVAKDTRELITEVTPYFTMDHMEFIIKKIQEMVQDKINASIIPFTAALCHKCSSFDQKNQLLQILWDVMTSDLPYDLTDAAESAILLIFKDPFFRVYRREYLDRMISQLHDPKCTTKSYYYDLIQSILSSYRNQDAKESDLTLYDIVSELQTLYTFHNYILIEFQQFKTECKTLLEDVPENERENYILEHAFPHSQMYVAELRQRLHLLYLIIVHAGISIDQRQFVTDLWSILYDDALTSTDQKECIDWFYAIQFNPAHEFSALGEEVIPYLFENHISKIDPRTMTESGFNCFKKYFQNANIFMSNMHTDNNSIEVLVAPAELLGEGALWEIALKSSEHVVVHLAMELLNTIYENVSEELTEKIGKSELRRRFISQSMHYISTSLEAYTSSTSTSEKEDNALTVERSLYNLVRMMDNTEPAASRHKTITRGTPLILDIRLDYLKDGFPYTYAFEHETHSRAIIHHVYRMVLAHCEAHLKEQGLELENITIMSLNIDFEDLGHTLEDMGIVNYQKIHLKRKPLYSTQETRLIPRNSYSNKKRPSEAEHYIQKISEISGLSADVSEYALSKWGWDMDRVVSELLDESRYEKLLREARANIKIKTYSASDDLMKVMQERNQKLFELIVEEDESDVSSSILSSNEDYWVQLFEILNMEHAPIVDLVWNLIVRIPIPQSIRTSLVSQFKSSSDEKVPWDTILPEDFYKRLFSLTIIDQVLFPLDPQMNLDLSGEWAQWFVKTGGLERLVTLFLKMDIQGIYDSETTPSIVYDLVILSLKTIEYFLRTKVDLIEATSLDPLRDVALDILRNYNVRYYETIHYTWKIFALISKLKKTEDSLTLTCKDLNEIIIHQLLYNSSELVRNETAVLMYTEICSYNTATLWDMANMLIQNLPGQAEDEDPDMYFQCEQFYWLLERVVRSTLQRVNIQPERKFEMVQFLASRLFEAVHNRPPYETAINVSPDWILCGSFRSLSAIFDHWSGIRVPESVLNMLLNECLFEVAKIDETSYPKCKTRESRSACYQLLLSIAKSDMQYFEDLLVFLATHHSGSYQKVGSWSYDPADEDKSSTGYVGIVNLGATCYMSSLLQQFFMIPQLRNDIIRCHIDNNISDPSENIVGQLQKMFGFLQESEKLSYNPREFCNSFRDLEGNIVQVNQQQDVNEFFNTLCLRIENQIKATPDDKLLHKHFVGTLSNQIRSEDSNYPYVSERVEEFYTIPLDVGNSSNLMNALDQFIKSDMLEGENQYHCDEYNTKINASRRCVIDKLPKTLIFHLMRFDYDLATNRKKKLNGYFHFPMSVDMSPWTKSGLENIEKGKSDADEPNQNQYELRGILVHAGDADSGHYYSFIRERREPYDWFQFNDRVVTAFNPDNIEQECFGGTYTQTSYDSKLGKNVTKELINDRNAYMLIYERVDPNEEVENIRLEETAPAVNEIIWAENSAFLKDRFLFDQAYIHFVSEFVKTLKTNTVEALNESSYEDLETDSFAGGDLTMCVVKLASRFTIEVVAHAKENDDFGWWIALLTHYFKTFIPGAVWFIEYLKRNNILKDILLTCTNERIRIEFSNLIVSLLESLLQQGTHYTSLANKQENSQPAHVTLITMVMDILEDSRPHWKRFKQYFSIVERYARLNKESRMVLLDLNILDLYQDYFMGSNKGKYERPSVMDEQYLPDLIEFYETLSVIMRGCKNESTMDTLPPNRISDDLIETPKGWDSFWDRRFFQSFLEMEYNVDAATEIIAYVSFDAPKRSDMIMEIIVDEFDETPRDVVYEHYLEAMILIEDSLVQSRLRNYISSFKYQNRIKITPLLKRAKNATLNGSSIILFVLKLANKSKHLYEFLCASRDLFWMADALEAALEEDYSDFDVDEEQIQKDIECGYHMLFFEEMIPSSFADEPRWRHSDEYFAFLYIHHMMSNKKEDVTNEHVIKSQSEEISKLHVRLEEERKINSQLEAKVQDLIERNKKLKALTGQLKRLDINIPKKMDEILKKVDEAVEESDAEEEQISVMSLMMSEKERPMDDKPVTVDLSEKIQLLKECFGDVEDEVLIEALTEHNYDVDSVATELFENPDKMNLYRIRSKVNNP